MKSIITLVSSNCFLILLPLTLLSNDNLNIEKNYSDKMNLGNEYYENEEFLKAYKEYLNAQKYGKVPSYVFNNLGFAFFHQIKDVELAKQAFQEVLKVNSLDPTANFGLSQIYFEYGKIDEAFEMYKTYSIHDKDKQLVINAERIGEILEKEGFDEDRKLEFFNNVLEINPQDYSAMYYLASHDLNNKDYAVALERFKQILDIAPHMKIVFKDIASCYANTGQPKLALEYFQKAKDEGINVPDQFFEILNERISEEE